MRGDRSGYAGRELELTPRLRHLLDSILDDELDESGEVAEEIDAEVERVMRELGLTP
jgi:hypothetical protein